MVEALDRVINSGGSAATAPMATSEAKQVFNKPVLQNQIADKAGKPVDQKNMEQFVEETFKSARRVAVKKSGKVRRVSKVQVTFKLTPDHLKKRMAPFLNFVNTYSAKYKLDRALVLAVIHTESYFNPMARSHCNAIGLMQLVPWSGGREAYQYVYGKDAMPKARYLYDPKNNIELGCTYLYLLKTRYFGLANKALKRVYLSISGYNTGPGNVALAFTNGKNLRPAIRKINGMGVKAVYNRLVARLPYAETREYLPMVVNRMELYR